MYFSFLVFKTSEKYKFGGLYIKIFEKFEFRKKKFFKLKNFSKKIIQPPKTNFQMILNTKNEKYMKVWQS